MTCEGTNFLYSAPYYREGESLTDEEFGILDMLYEEAKTKYD